MGLHWTLEAERDCRPLWRLAALACALVLAGCSAGTPQFENKKPTHPVSGKVTVNGQPAAGAFVLLVPVNEAAETTDPRPRAEVATDGSFKVFTYDEGDGAPAGNYIVTIRWQGGVRPDGSEEPPDKLMGRYSDPSKSQIRVQVKEGANELPPFALR